MAVNTEILPPRYRSPTSLGAGGMGVVYRTLDTALGRHVAVKVLDERHAHNPELRARFTREALAAARLSGESHVVTIFDVGEWNNRPYIVMEDLEGGSLARRLERGPVPPAQALDWLAQAADALDAAHENGVVHRDVKPGNLLLDGEGNLRVADFGIASAAGTDALTMTGTVLGTAGYLAPEQARGERAQPASDRYALGIVAYELLTGSRPFEEPSPEPRPVPSVRTRDQSLPVALDAVFARALAARPDARPATASELVDDLRAALRPPDVTTRAMEPPTRVIPAPVPVARRRSRLPWVLIGILAAGVAGAAIAAAVVGGDGGGAAAPPTPSVRVRTVTAPGTTLRETVTARATTAPVQPPPPPPPPPPPAPTSSDGHTLNDQGYSRLQAGDAAGALPLLQQAVQKLSGVGPADPYEAYANFNLGTALVALGRCAEAIPYLDTAKHLEPGRHEVDDALKQAHDCAKGQPKPPKPKGH